MWLAKPMRGNYPCSHQQQQDWRYRSGFVRRIRSTLIACEHERRHARLMEIDPKYADVIIRRWQDHTGEKAILESAGIAFDEIEGVRLRKAA
jgi:hypothetical protein